MSNNKNNQNTQSYHTPHFNPYHYYPPYHYLPNYTEQNNYNIDNLYKNINSLKKDILHLQSLYYHDRMDINIANHYIDSSVKEINKLIPSVADRTTQIKLNEVVTLLQPLDKTQSVKDENIISLLQYYQLIDELKIAK